MLTPSVSRGRAPVNCPVCAAQSPENDDNDAIATVGGAENERRSGAILEAFQCPVMHTLNDLTPAQEREVLESAREWLADGRDALRDAYFDARFDRMRDDGF